MVQSVIDRVEKSCLTAIESGLVNLERIILNEFVDEITAPETDIFKFPQHEEVSLKRST